MSSHADTIRRAIRAPYSEFNDDARAALDALEADLALSRNLYDELFAQTEQLRRERDDFEQRLHAYKSGEHGTPSAAQTLEDVTPHKEKAASSDGS